MDCFGLGASICSGKSAVRLWGFQPLDRDTKIMLPSTALSFDCAHADFRRNGMNICFDTLGSCHPACYYLCEREKMRVSAAADEALFRAD
ncbi:hypothetical protein GLOTRDRAFT_110287 [Gloeophyllum trabeum ATCC 11539]|uniref:Uncharacterized protein n=1 Tax=Gloeophyllum trabeum (strain ATCC 11539 / FP-39264 / Madison 617) TaxID=670483 RepID=S7QFM0_GLOTA|nr:uncharacterized protein GLOTRDRAFT_110287 [Gloeophyllum trabeum ATCC 11539]EPQ58641.1 hypothetical protein GLOTRDRAFT_110287 [Gloeophyllum trabeum ATCC 11539]